MSGGSDGLEDRSARADHELEDHELEDRMGDGDGVERSLPARATSVTSPRHVRYQPAPCHGSFVSWVNTGLRFRLHVPGTVSYRGRRAFAFLTRRSYTSAKAPLES